MTMDILPVKAPLSYPPRVTEFTEPYWRALSRGLLWATECASCGHRTLPPKPICPQCWHGNVEWAEMTTRGTLYSWTRVHAAPAAFASEVPYCVAIVDLASGTRIACRLVETPSGDPAIGAEVELVVLEHLDGPLLAARVKLGAGG